MEKLEFSNAYSEVLEILKYISKEDYNKIPKQKIDLFKANSNKEYSFIYNPEKTLDEQNVSKLSKTIIAILFRDYWATDSQREKIVSNENYARFQIEKQKADVYNLDNIFNTKKTVQAENLDQNETEKETIEIVEYKQGFIAKILKKIKAFFFKED